MRLASLCALIHVFVMLSADTMGPNDSSWWGQVQERLPWYKANYGVRIPINEPGIKKGL